MSIVLIGGHERMYDRYIRLAKKKGHKLKVMSKMKTDLCKRIGQPDGIIVFTNTVSHKMVIATQVSAKKYEIPIVKCHNSSQQALEQTLRQLNQMVLVSMRQS